ncbi:MAG TPA: hypothetical protein VET25_00555 [Aestuariivirgaceae bacterium]|nr:hypothetical protein [Aestuariivirgaceae bacterium]
MDVASEYGGIPASLTDDELKHDNVVPWIALQSRALGRPIELVTDEAMSTQTNALSPMYRRIADRLEELQDHRSQRTGRKIDRPDYPRAKGLGKGRDKRSVVGERLSEQSPIRHLAGRAVSGERLKKTVRVALQTSRLFEPHSWSAVAMES